MNIIREFKVPKYISDAGIEFLPHGVITKSHTGMGATYLELISSRNSILVEPIKYTAYSKVGSYNKEKIAKEHGEALYVGSEVIQGDKPVNQDVITRYVKNKKIKVKKIICVADSLYKVVEVLLKCKLLDDYFLLIDEIDSIQTDSSFRYRIEQCLDIYFMFPKEKRALLTATPIDFSNDKLKDEVKTNFTLKSPNYTDLQFFQTYTGIEVLTKRILDFINDTSEELPIAVCVNSIKAIQTLINTLVDRFHVDDSQIGVLCGSQSEFQLQKYVVEMKSQKYPKPITFFTSAYYSGYDINTEYKLFILADYKYPNTLLSGGQVKQITGRYRGKRTTPVELVFSQIPKVYPQKNPQLSKANRLTFEGMTKIGNSLIKSLHCMKHNFSGIGDELDLMEAFKNGAFKALEKDNMRIVREEVIKDGDSLKTGDYVISYLFIDAKLEYKRVLNHLYINSSIKSIDSEFIQNGFKISHQTGFDKVDVDYKVNAVEKEINKVFLEDLLKSKDLDEYDFYVKIKEYQQSKTTQQVKRLSDLVLKMLGYYTVQEIIGLITGKVMNEKNGNMKDNRSLDNLSIQVNFRLTDKDFTPRIIMGHYFKKGEILTNRDIADRIDKVLKKSSMKIPSLDQDKDSKTVKSLVMLAKNYVLLKRTRVNSAKNSYKIGGVIPVQELLKDSLFYGFLKSKKSLVKGRGVQKKYVFNKKAFLSKQNLKVNELSSESSKNKPKVIKTVPNQKAKGKKSIGSRIARLNENITHHMDENMVKDVNDD